MVSYSCGGAGIRREETDARTRRSTGLPKSCAFGCPPALSRRRQPVSCALGARRIGCLLRCYNGRMPELSRFFGIIIRMYAEFGATHHTPHFHAHYQDDVAVFSIDLVELISGSLPKRQQRLVEAWAELHQAELLADWQQLQAGGKPRPIAPLR